MSNHSQDLALSVKLPATPLIDLRGPGGPWIDYFRATYPTWAKASEPERAHARPWPEGFEPSRTPIFAHNEIEIAAPPTRVFAALLDAQRWPTYYENASRIELGEGSQRLGPSARFRFTTFGVPYDAEITIFEPDRALAWTCRGGMPRLTVHHRWLLEPSTLGTRLVTEETNFISSLGWLNPVNRWFNEKLARSGTKEALPAAHQRWLTELKRVVEAGSS